MTEAPPSKGKGARKCFYCRPTDDKGGTCHAPDSDGRSASMLQLKRTKKTKEGQEVKDQDHFCCTGTCGYCGTRRLYEYESHIYETPRVQKTQESRGGVAYERQKG